MKFFILALIFLFLSVPNILAQENNDTMYVHQKNGKITKIATADIDSVIFYQTDVGYPTIEDIDGNIYRIVQIGSQVWMAEDLKTTHFNDGTEIPEVTDNDEWNQLETPAYSWYNNDEGYSNTYGALYNWYVANSDKICPKGWHVPTDQEWSILINFVGGDAQSGGKLKEIGFDHWREPNSGATDEYGFTALPAGHRYGNDGTFKLLGEECRWWTSTEHETFGSAWFRAVKYGSRNTVRHHLLKFHGFCLRCVQD